MQTRFWLFILALLGACGVMLGAFAAHGLKGVLSAYHLEVFNTGVLYQFIHVLAGFVVVILARNSGEKAQKRLRLAVICFIIGIFCFSGSLYALALTGIKWFGPVTPFGGLMYIAGWLTLAMSALKIEEVTQ